MGRTVVRVGKADKIGFDGFAKLKLLSGQASIMGYCLPRNVEVAVSCNSQLSGSLLTIEPCREQKCPCHGQDSGRAGSTKANGAIAAVVNIEAWHASRPSNNLEVADQEEADTSFVLHRAGEEHRRRDSEPQGARLGLVPEVEEETFQDMSKEPEEDASVGGDGSVQRKKKKKKKKRGSLDQVEGETDEGRGEERRKRTSTEREEHEDRDVGGGVEGRGEGGVSLDFVDGTNTSTGATSLRDGPGDLDGAQDGATSATPPHLMHFPLSWWLASKRIVTSGSRGCPAPVTVVVGPRNTGKSTFCQFLVNRLLGRYPRVAFLETDVGQPELTAPGLVSLHILTEPMFGPPCLHLRKAKQAFFFGDVSPKADPLAYLRCCLSLFDGLQAGSGHGDESSSANGVLPVVINTHGWIRGLGYDVVVDLLRHVTPHHVVQLLSPVPAKNLPSGTFWSATDVPCSTETYHLETGAPSDEARIVSRGAKDARALRMLAYFSPSSLARPDPNDVAPSPVRAFPLDEAAAFMEVGERLTWQRPYCVSTRAVAIWHLYCQVDPNESLRAINASIVGLCCSRGLVAEPPPDLQGGANKADEPLPCLGLGLVRSVDAAQGRLFLLTPVPLEELRSVTVIVQGRLELPLAMMQISRRSPYICHSSISAEGTGASAIRSRNNLLRRSMDAA